MILEALGTVLVAGLLFAIYAALFRRARMSGRVDRSDIP